MIVRTLLDTDLYKFTTSYAYIKLFPYAMGKFSFHDRNETEYTEEFLERLKNEIDKLPRMNFQEKIEYSAEGGRLSSDNHIQKRGKYRPGDNLCYPLVERRRPWG